MDITITEAGNQIIATFDGRLDTVAAQQISETITPLLDHADQTVVLDCEQMPFISSSGLRIFLTVRKAAAAKGGKVIVRDITPEIRQVFMMTGFLNLFEIQES